MAKILSPRKRKVIVLVSDMIGDYSTELCNGLSQYLQKRPDLTLWRISPAQFDKGFPLDDFAGIISDAFFRSRVERMKSTGLPIVDMSGEMVGDPLVTTLDTDMAKTGTIAAERLLQRGFKSFGYFGIDGMRDCDILSGAFKARVEKAGCECRVLRLKFALLPTYLTRRGKFKDRVKILKWLKSLPPHTAVFCLNDTRAYAVLSWCLEIGRAVPQDIAIMGTNNDVSRCMCAPVHLSSIDMNWRGLGYAAIRLIAHAIDHPEKPKVRRPFLVPPKGIVERESTAVYQINPPWLAEVLSLIDENMDSPISAADLETTAGVSHTTLQSAFRKTFGMSPGKYIMSIKMREAKRLVDEGNLSIKEIASRTGFTSRSYFSRAYSNYFGHAPAKGRPRQ